MALDYTILESKNFTPIEEKMIKYLLEKEKLHIIKLNVKIEKTVKKLETLGYVKASREYIVLTKAGKTALENRKPGKPVILALKNGEKLVRKLSTKTRKKLEKQGYLCLEGYLLKGTLKVKPKKPRIGDVLEALDEGKTKYAAIKLYNLAKATRDSVLIEKAKKIVEKPDILEIIKLLDTIKQRYQKYL